MLSGWNRLLSKATIYLRVLFNIGHVSIWISKLVWMKSLQWNYLQWTLACFGRWSIASPVDSADLKGKEMDKYKLVGESCDCLLAVLHLQILLTPSVRICFIKDKCVVQIHCWTMINIVLHWYIFSVSIFSNALIKSWTKLKTKCNERVNCVDMTRVLCVNVFPAGLC